MSNNFNKEERVLFDAMLEAFEDKFVMLRNVTSFTTDPKTMERTSDTIWRPLPYISKIQTGFDQTSNFKTKTQLSVPMTLSTLFSDPWEMTSKELRDSIQEGNLFKSATQGISSAINLSISNAIRDQSSIFVKRTSAAAGYDDAAKIEQAFNERGVPDNDRVWAISTADYNGLASNLAGRQTLNGKALTAYEKAYVGQIASFDTYKLDYCGAINAAAGSGITIDTRASAGNYYVPTSTAVGINGIRQNVDNRYQTITVSSTTGVVAGDSFTIANVRAVHRITHDPVPANNGLNSGLQTFKVISVPSSTTLVISMPIISAQGGSDSELQYQNCYVASEASNAAITFLNTSGGYVNPFWQKDAILFLPGRASQDEGKNDGAQVMRAVTEVGGVEIFMVKQYDAKTRTTFYRVDSYVGVCVAQPDMVGQIMFSQS